MTKQVFIYLFIFFTRNAVIHIIDRKSGLMLVMITFKLVWHLWGPEIADVNVVQNPHGGCEPNYTCL